MTLFKKTINTVKANHVAEMRSSISDAISLASKNGVWPAHIIDQLESCLAGLRLMELNRQQMAPAQIDQVTLRPRDDRSAQRAEERRAAEALRREQEAYAAEVNRRGYEQAIRDGKTA